MSYENSFAYKLLQKFEAMRDRVLHYVAVIDQCPVPAFILSRDGKDMYYVNASFRDLFGKDETVLQDGRWLDLIHPDDRKEMKAIWEEYLKNPVNNVPVMHCHRYQTLSGDMRTVTKVTAIPENGIVGYIVCANNCTVHQDGRMTLGSCKKC